MNGKPRINFCHATSILVLSILGVACAGNRGPESNQHAVLPVIFSSEAGDTIEIYPDRLVVGDKSYDSVDCSVAEYHCMAFDPIGAIVVPKHCDNSRFEEWHAGPFRAIIRTMIHHTPVLVTSDYRHFAYLLNQKERGVMVIFYDMEGSPRLNGSAKSNGHDRPFPKLGEGYYKQEGPAVFPCE